MLISIVIPTYNHGDTIEECLDSIFAQTFKDFEVIVVNDGSIDNTLQVLEKYGDRIKIINQENRGAPAARNHGFRKSIGRFLLFCDADIIMKPDMLLKMLNTLKDHPEASYVYSSFKLGWKTFKLQKFDAEKLKQANYISTMSLIRREHFPGFSAEGGPAAGWDESLKKFQDWDLWLTILDQGHTGVWIPGVLFTAKPRQGGISHWLPSFMHKIPWDGIGWMPKEVKKYKKALKIIKEKHRLS